MSNQFNLSKHKANTGKNPPLDQNRLQKFLNELQGRDRKIIIFMHPKFE